MFLDCRFRFVFVTVAIVQTFSELKEEESLLLKEKVQLKKVIISLSLSRIIFLALFTDLETVCWPGIDKAKINFQRTKNRKRELEEDEGEFIYCHLIESCF